MGSAKNEFNQFQISRGSQKGPWGSERLEREALTPLYTMNRPNILTEAKLSCHKK